MSVTLYIVYNSSNTFFGKIGYQVRRFSTTTENPSACAATDLTNNGTDQESSEWIATKAKIPATIKQVHYNELAPEVKKYIEHNHYEYPCIIGRSIDGHFRLLLTDYDISTVADNHAKFLELLKTRFQQNNLPWDSVVTENFVKS